MVTKVNIPQIANAARGYRGTVTDFNATLTQGQYNFGAANITGAWTAATIYGVLVVMVNDFGTHNNTSNWIWQFAYNSVGEVFWRVKINAGAWSAWNNKIANDTGWVDFTLLNGATAYSSGSWGTPAYRKIGNIVYLRGLVAGTANGVAFATLPAGFRPIIQSLFAAEINPNTIGRVDIFANGNVTPGLTNATWMSLHGISFVAEQ